jgi:hypothetical protein
MSVEKISRMLDRRPPSGRLREQLFWLVDLVFACKASGDQRLASEARLVEDALGAMGEYLETGNSDALRDSSARVEQFARAVMQAVLQARRAGEI